MKFNWRQFATVALGISSTVLPMVSPALVPLASVIGHAIGQAEAMPGKTGAEKLALVQGIVATVAPTIPGVNPAEVSEVLQEGIDAVVAATNVIVKPVAAPVVPPA